MPSDGVLMPRFQFFDEDAAGWCMFRQKWRSGAKVMLETSMFALFEACNAGTPNFSFAGMSRYGDVACKIEFLAWP